MNQVKFDDLKEAKALLDQKVFGYDDFSYEQVETLYEVMSKMDTKGAVDYTEQFLQNFEDYCTENGINSEKVSVSMALMFYASEEDFEKIVENGLKVKPIVDDLVSICLCNCYTDGNESFAENLGRFEPDNYGNGVFVASFSEFRNLLSQRGYEIDGAQSFEDLVEYYLNGEKMTPVIKISRKSKDFNFSEVNAPIQEGHGRIR